jgi:hypothetical protein
MLSRPLFTNQVRFGCLLSLTTTKEANLSDAQKVHALNAINQTLQAILNELRAMRAQQQNKD